MSTIRQYLPSFGIGALLCLMLAMWISPGGEADWLWELWDESHPVVVTHATDVQHDGDGVIFKIIGEKRRQCTFVGVHAYAEIPSGAIRQHQLIGIVRVDRPPTNATRPLGAADFGLWRAWPVAGAVSVEVWATYRCSSRIVLNQLAEVQL
jgi:hypothetical protein